MRACMHFTPDSTMAIAVHIYTQLKKASETFVGIKCVWARIKISLH